MNEFISEPANRQLHYILCLHHRAKIQELPYCAEKVTLGTLYIPKQGWFYEQSTPSKLESSYLKSLFSGSR